MAEVDLRGQLAGAPVRAVLVVGHQPPSVEAGERYHLVGMGSCDAPAQPCSHAVARYREWPAGHVGEEVEVATAVALDQFWCEPLHHRPDLLHERPAHLRILEIGHWQHRRLAMPVEHIGSEHHEAAFRDPVGHLFDLGTQPEGIYQEQHPRPTTVVVRRPRQVAVGDAVLGSDRNVFPAHVPPRDVSRLKLARGDVRLVPRG
jgi:hypothetical protein